VKAGEAFQGRRGPQAEQSRDVHRPEGEPRITPRSTSGLLSPLLAFERVKIVLFSRSTVALVRHRPQAWLAMWRRRRGGGGGGNRSAGEGRRGNAEANAALDTCGTISLIIPRDRRRW
jgi:hypothetical protein